MAARRENETLREELRLMHIQLQSLEKVMRLQEREASKSLTGRHHLPPSQAAPYQSQKRWEFGGGCLLCRAYAECTSVSLHVIGRADGLLRAWRHHVLRLLMQQTAEAESTDREKADLRMKLETAASQAQTLQVHADSLSLKLQASDAALQAANQKSGTVFDGVPGGARAEGLRSNTTALATLLRRLQVLERRLDFASSRLPLVRSLLARSRHLSRQTAPTFLPLDTNGAGLENSSTQTEWDLGVGYDVDLTADVEELKEMVRLAHQERQQAIADRDLLASRLEEDSRTFQERVDAVKAKCEFQSVTMKSRETGVIICELFFFVSQPKILTAPLCITELQPRQHLSHNQTPYPT
ncbi:unnamed protein product [Schistocephalus solidus]|uniref:t-SNARE coiled-coil homology domain-containing protein n=1 Tax=Schistocephalus solidus TaxID=70667 RepID=A0A183TMP6_SCHSO|nr:unnamed protein product [Schistocephalus solidus]